MNRLINKIVSKLKKSDWKLDPNIPFSYLFFLLTERMIMLIRGFWKFKRISKIIFIGRYTILKCKSKIIINGTLTIARNCYIDALSINGIVFGHDVSVGKNTSIECSGSFKNIGLGLTVGNHVGLGTHGFFGCAGGVEIGDYTIFGNFVSIHSENHNFSDLSLPIKDQGITRIGIKIGKNCWIGAKVTILDGVVVQDGCVIGANSLLTKGVYNANCIYGGNPAKLIRERA